MALQDNAQIEQSGAAYTVKLASEDAKLYRKIFGVRDMSISEAPRERSREPSLNSGTATLTGPRGDITATMTLGRNTESPGQGLLIESHADNAKINIRRVRTDSENVSTAVTLQAGTTFAISALTTSGGGEVTFVGSGLNNLKAAIVQGMWLKHVSGSTTKRYFIEEVRLDSSGDIDKVIIAAGETGTTDPFYWNGDAVAAQSAGTLTLVSGRVETLTLTGTVTTPPTPSDAASTTPTGVTTTVEIGVDSYSRSYADPS